MAFPAASDALPAAVCRAFFEALLGTEGVKVKYGVADARVAAASAAGKNKKDLMENIMLGNLRSMYAILKEALAKAGGVTDEEELYTNEATLAKCMALLSQQLFDLLPPGTPRFDRQPEMMSRVLAAMVIDEAHMLALKRWARHKRLCPPTGCFA